VPASWPERIEWAVGVATVCFVCWGAWMGLRQLSEEGAAVGWLFVGIAIGAILVVWLLWQMLTAVF
jgi:hypothetical protein